MCTPPAASADARTRIRTHLENITTKVQRAAGALRAARDLSCMDGRVPQSPYFVALTAEDFYELASLITEQLDAAVEEINVTHQEVSSC
jgi:hypothetical protein